MSESKPETVHRFLDETGDTTFYGRGRKLIPGQNGVSLTFGMGIVRIDRPLAEVRSEITALQRQVEADPRLVVDLYDRAKYDGNRNYYTKKNPLTSGNKIGPPLT